MPWHEFDFWSAKQHFMNKHSKWVKYCFWCKEIKFISSSCHVILLHRQKGIDKIKYKLWREITEIMSVRKSRVTLWKINHSDRRCSFNEFYEWYNFPVKHNNNKLSKLCYYWLQRTLFFLLFKIVLNYKWKVSWTSLSIIWFQNLFFVGWISVTAQ